MPCRKEVHRKQGIIRRQMHKDIENAQYGVNNHSHVLHFQGAILYSVAWLEHHLQTYPGTVIAVTHDRYFLDNVAGWILELDRGQGIPWKGNYSSWLEQKRNRLQQEEKTESERQKTLQRELEWIQMSPKGRHAKSNARIASYEELLRQDTDKGLKEAGL